MTTRRMLFVVECRLQEERSWGWMSNPTITRLWRIQTYLRNRLKRQALAGKGGAS